MGLLRNWNFYFFILMSFFLIACGGEDEVSKKEFILSINFSSDFVQGVEFSSLQVVPDKGAKVEVAAFEGKTDFQLNKLVSLKLPESDRREITINLINQTGTAILMSRKIVVKHHQNKIVNVMMTRSCLNVDCPDSNSSECLNGVCISDRCVNGIEPICGDLKDSFCSSDAECPMTDACANAKCVKNQVCMAFSKPENNCQNGEFCHPYKGCLSIIGMTKRDASVDTMMDADMDAMMDAGM